MALAPGARMGPYEIVTPIGKGGIGEVYRARDTKLGRDVAIKVLQGDLASDPERLRRFEQEARCASALNHPNIITIHDIGEDDGTCYIAMEYVEGVTLREMLGSGPLPNDKLTRYATQMAEGLAKAHDAGIVHRDLKPENIIISDDGYVKILDFGLVKLMPSRVDSEMKTMDRVMTRNGVIVGTVQYMSPEQAAGRNVDHRSDQFALGSIVYEMATGKRAFVRDSAAQTLASIIESDPEPVRAVNPRVPVTITKVIDRCLSKDAAERYASTWDIAKELHLQEQATPARTMTPRSRATIGILGLLAIGIAMMFGLFLSDIREWLPGETDVPEIESIAVLPLENLSGDPEQEYFVDGMHEALTTELAKIRALKVISRTSAMQYEGVKKPMDQIARELGVDGLIEGSVAREGDQVRITVQLIDGSTDQHLWAESFDRELRGILALQSEVARAIATQIRVRLTREDETRLASTRPIDPAAYEAYLKGQYHWNKLNRDGWEAAVNAFQESIEMDPTYAPAYAMMSFAYSLLGYYSLRSPDVLYNRALEAAERAVSFDDTLAEAHASLAFVKTSFGWDWPAADRSSREAIRLNPTSTMALYSRAFFLFTMGRHDEAVDTAKRAVDLDPVAPHVNTWLGMFYFMARRYDEAIEQLNRVLALEPDYNDALVWLSYSYAKKGLFEDAATASSSFGRPWLDAWILALGGRSAEARKMLEQYDEGAATPIEAYFVAVPYGELGDHDRALALLERSHQGRSALMSVVKVDPRMDALRNDPRFQDLLQKMNFPP